MLSSLDVGDRMELLSNIDHGPDMLSTTQSEDYRSTFDMLSNNDFLTAKAVNANYLDCSLNADKEPFRITIPTKRVRIFIQF